MTRFVLSYNVFLPIGLYLEVYVFFQNYMLSLVIRFVMDNFDKFKCLSLWESNWLQFSVAAQAIEVKSAFTQLAIYLTESTISTILLCKVDLYSKVTFVNNILC